VAVTISLATKLPKLTPLTTDTWKAALFTSAWGGQTQDTVDLYSALTGEVANGNGYTTGGNALSAPSITQTDGTNKQTYDANDPGLWTASGAGFSFQYVLVYDVTSGKVIGQLDYGSSLTLNGANGDTFQVTFDVLGIFTTTVP
jgi:hypothetical protein